MDFTSKSIELWVPVNNGLGLQAAEMGILATEMGILYNPNEEEW